LGSINRDPTPLLPPPKNKIKPSQKPKKKEKKGKKGKKRKKKEKKGNLVNPVK
jgi:hypothetical protein